MELRARPATEDDMMLIFKWANDSVTRDMSFSSEPILLETHKKWFANVLDTPDIHLLVIEGKEANDWVPVGQVRFDPEGEITIALASEFRGHGIGESLITSGISYLKDKLRSKTITAHIKKDNLPSIKVFEKAGFQLHGETRFKGHPCFEYIYEIE